jgi:hypothetical protein
MIARLVAEALKRARLSAGYYGFTTRPMKRPSRMILEGRFAW